MNEGPRRVTLRDAILAVVYVLVFVGIAVCAGLNGGCSLAPRPRAWTCGEVALGVVSMGAAAWNYIEAEGAFDRGAGYEMNPLFGRHPSDGELLVGMVGTEVLTLVVGNFYPTVTLPVFGECELRVPLLVGKGVANVGLALHDRGVGR